MNYFNYFSEIEETFVRRRGRHLFISPKDWALIGAWEDQGIPLHIAIRAINCVFDIYDKQPKGTRMISSLSFCSNEVEAQFVEWRASQIGAGGDNGHSEKLSIGAVEAHIDGAIEKLKALGRKEIAEDIDRAVIRLAEIRSTLTEDWEVVDAALNDVEKTLDAAMLTGWKAADVKAAEKAVTDQLSSYKAEMEPDAYQNTFSLMLLKRLREEGGIPRLGLFYL